MNPNVFTARCFRTLQELVVHLKYLLGLRQTTTTDADADADADDEDSKTEQLAAVFDIDDTVVGQFDTYAGLQRTPGSIYRIHSMCDLVQHCYANKVAIFFVTARRNDDATDSVTRAQLHALGIPETMYKGIYYRPLDRQDIGVWKKQARVDIISKGYTIFLNAGDQWHDVSISLEDKLAHDMIVRQTNVVLVNHPGDTTSLYHCKLTTFYACSQPMLPSVLFRVTRKLYDNEKDSNDSESESEFVTANELEDREASQV